MKVRLYGIPGSHPCMAAMAAADYKGIEYTRVDIPPVQHKLQMKLLFGGSTVPAMKIDGEKVQGSRQIMRTLDSVKPDPPLFPSDPAERAAVLAAETWGEGEFQDLGRRFIWSHLSRDVDTMLSYAVGAKVPIPGFVQKPMRKPIAKIAAWYNKADDEAVKADIAAVPAMLDKVDAFIADGVIGGAQPNAADFQIFSSLGLWMTIDDLRPAIESRPCGKATRKLFPNYPGHIPAGVLPGDWFAPLREPAIAA